MNKFKINVIPVFINSNSNKYNIILSIQIDEKILNTNYDVDIFEIIQLISNDDNDIEHFWTCDCGVAACAGIVGINTIHRGDIVYCIFPDKISTSSSLDYKAWTQQKTFKTYKFSKIQIAKSLLDLADKINSTVKEQDNNSLIGYNIGMDDYGCFEPIFDLPNYIRHKVFSCFELQLQ